MDLSDPELIVTGLELDSWEASSMTCYTSLAIIARDLMSDQVRHRCVDFIWASQTGVPWFMEKQKGIVFWLTMVDDELLCIIDIYWSAFLKIEGKQNSPTVIVPISKESSSHQHQPRKSKILQVFQKLLWSSFRTHHIRHQIWLPVVLNWSESELSKGYFNLQVLDGRILGGHLCRDKIRC